MANEAYEYNGHWISIDVDERRGGTYTWSYTIDGQHFTENQDRPLPNEGAMLREAKHSAERKADRLPPAE
ncbi:hypothetical protein [Paraburkholderia sp. A3RO-2L]|uniref:hypothetical protein n=1 Tax=Paraburkholderia sp. A3RO-2L TaxID=3028376 RepID=UPI003DA95714